VTRALLRRGPARWALTVALLGLALPAVAGRKGRKDDDVGPDPEEVAAQEAAACAKDVPENYQIHTGYGSSSDPAEAIAEAERAARKLALDTLCAGKSEARCTSIRRHIEGWKQPYHNPISGRACAHVGVNRQWIDDDRREQARLHTELVALGGRVAAATEGQRVALRPARWAESGCDAGEVGTALRAELRNALAQTDAELVPVGTSKAVEVAVRLEVVGAKVVVLADVRAPGAEGTRPIEGLSFPSDLFVLDEVNRDCRLDRALGLEGGHRRGADGMRVWIDPGVEGLVCEGDRGEPEVRVSRPAKVKVWSVDRLGRAYLVWPPPGDDGVVQRTMPLGRVTYHRPLVGGEERLLAAAVPADGTFGSIDEWTGFCLQPGVLSSDSYPDAAAVAAASLTVLPWAHGTCAQRDTARSEPPAMPDVPVCPARLGG